MAQPVIVGSLVQTSEEALCRVLEQDTLSWLLSSGSIHENEMVTLISLIFQEQSHLGMHCLLRMGGI